jgi:hypothetical protein
MPALTPPPASNFIESLRSRIVEGRTFNPYEYRPVAIPLQVTLGATRPQGTASFTIPSNQRLILFQFTPIVVPSSISAANNDPAAMQLAAGGNLDVILARATNCRINLGLASRTFDLFVQQAFTLSDLLSTDGTDPSLMDMPGMIPQGTNIDLNAALVDPKIKAAGPVTVPDCEYGIVLIGAYVQV